MPKCTTARLTDVAVFNKCKQRSGSFEFDSKYVFAVDYSLGNFISWQNRMPCMLGGLADITIVKEDECYTEPAASLATPNPF